MNGSYSTKERIDQARLLNKYDFTDITNSFKIPRSAKDISLQSNQLRLDWDSVADKEAYSLSSSKRYKSQGGGGGSLFKTTPYYTCGSGEYERMPNSNHFVCA